MNLEAFRFSILWFSSGIVLNRAKYIILSIIVSQLGLINLVTFYLTIRIVTEIASLTNRFIGGTYNRFLRDHEKATQKLDDIINDSLKLSAILGCFGGLIVFLSAHPIAFLIKNNQLTLAIQLFSLSVPFMVITNQAIQILSLKTRFKEVVVFQYVLESALVLVAAYFAINLLKSNMTTVLILQVVANIIFLPLAIFFLKKSLRGWKLKVGHFVLPINFSPPAIYTPLSVGLINVLDLLIIGFYLGTLALGLYIAMLVGPSLVFAIAINSFGMFTHTISVISDKEKVVRLCQKVLQYILIIATPLTLSIILYPQDTFNKIIQTNAPVQPEVVKLLALGFYLKIFSWMAERVLIVEKIAKLNAIINVSLSIVTLPLLLIVVPKLGLLGAALIVFIVAIVEVVFKTILAYRNTNIHFLSKETIKTVFLGIVMYIIFNSAIIIDFNSFLVYSSFLYLAGIIFLGCFKKHDLTILTRRFKGQVPEE